MSKHRTVFLPRNLEIEVLITERPPEFRPFNQDHLRFILHQISNIYARNNDRYSDARVPLNSSILVRYISNYQDYLRYLIDCGIIETNGYYKPNEKSRCYGFSKHYRNVELKGEVITNRLLLAKLNSSLYRGDEYHEATTKRGYLTKHFGSGKLIIDGVAATEWLDQSFQPDQDVYKKGITAINNFKEQNWHFSLSEKGGRLYSDLTGIKKELRNFLSYEGKPLVEKDISCSQPFMLLGLLKPDFWKHPNSSTEFRLRNISDEVWSKYKCSNKYFNKIVSHINMLVNSYEIGHGNGFDDIQLYRDLVGDGSYYDYLTMMYQEECHERFADRERIKKTVMWIMNGNQYDLYIPPGGMKCNPIELFSMLFPSVHNFLVLLKEIGHEYVARLLQGVESFIVLNRIGRRINKERPNMPLFTIHDCIVTTIDNEAYLEAVMLEEIEKHIGCRPSIKTKCWTPKNLQ
ncbi:hypothetical protein HGH93_08600 [Chitinophaga polysaccharea]|uniref:hypothetical protein n=1 Tax=Chitinophaga polysaccharea TaxID=1293035 RepID=UPI0014550243|nr:hypothetical protein [Chitinophaga polysaccharea]NLR58154.1 hypothetical protein [Chitinophaga polysaccharea]